MQCIRPAVCIRNEILWIRPAVCIRPYVMHTAGSMHRQERLQNRYTHKIFSMDWLSGILKRVAKIFGVWLAEKGV